jgi:hypothetical protein
MVAEVVTPFDRGLDPQHSNLTRAQQKAQKSRAAFVIRFGRAHSPRDKFDVAADYLRGVVNISRVDRDESEAALEQLARAMIDRADALAKTIRRHR